MVHQITYFKDALCAWEQWNLSDFEYRFEQLSALALAVEKSNPKLNKLINFHLEQAKALAMPHQLVGPTGETNELYFAGRGVTLLVLENELTQKENVLYSCFSMICSALISGNSLILCSDNIEITQVIKNALENTNFPANLVQLAAFDTCAVLLEADIRTLAFIGSTSLEYELNLQLAQKQGAIINLVSETHLENPSCIYDPHLSLSFISERTRTINITAVGGNATLLELGTK